MFNRNDLVTVLPGAPYCITVPGRVLSFSANNLFQIVWARHPENNGSCWDIDHRWVRLSTPEEIYRAIGETQQSNGARNNYVDAIPVTPTHGYVNPSPIVAPAVNRLPGGFTLGWELEACNAASCIPDNVDDHEDGSVNNDSMEYVSSEYVINDSKKCLSALKELCEDSDINTDTSCGFHVHLGLPGNSRKNKVWAAWMVTLGRLVEENAFGAVPSSRRSNQYCKSLLSDLDSIKSHTYVASKMSNHSRYYWLNVVEMFRPGGIRTVEIRLLGNTTRWEYVYAWISVCHLMGQAAMRLTTDPSNLAKEARKLNEMFVQIKEAFVSGGTYTYEQKKELAYTLAHQAKIGPAYVAPRMTEDEAIQDAIDLGYIEPRFTEERAIRSAILDGYMHPRLSEYWALDYASRNGMFSIRVPEGVH